MLRIESKYVITIYLNNISLINYDKKNRERKMLTHVISIGTLIRDRRLHVSRLHVTFIVSACTTETGTTREEEVAGPAKTYSKPDW